MLVTTVEVVLVSNVVKETVTVAELVDIDVTVAVLNGAVSEDG